MAGGASVVPGPGQSLVSYSWAMARPKGGYTPLSTVLATLLCSIVHCATCELYCKVIAQHKGILHEATELMAQLDKDKEGLMSKHTRNL